MGDWILYVSGPLVGIAAIATALGGLFQYRAQKRRELLAEIVQGSKESAAAAASNIRDGRLPRLTRHQDQIFRALCLATIYESSGRSRAVIYDALDSRMRVKGTDGNRIATIVDQLTTAVARSGGYTDLSKPSRRLMVLRAALALDGDRRTRLSATELFTATSLGDDTSPCHCKHEAHEWDHLREVVAQLGGVVLVCKDSPANAVQNAAPEPATSVPVISLDYLRIQGSGSKHGLSFSGAGQAVVDAKYVAGSGPNDEAITQLCRRLALVVRASPAYGEANRIAAVPATRHTLSDDLGREVSRLTQKPSVVLRPLSGRGAEGGPSYHVDEDLSGVTVILIDDVYRTGVTFANAAKALSAAGATRVLGLTATCTVTASKVPCGVEEPQAESSGAVHLQTLPKA